MQDLIIEIFLFLVVFGSLLGIARWRGFVKKEGDEPDVSESGTRARRAFWGHTFKGLVVLILGFILFSYLEFQQ